MSTSEIGKHICREWAERIPGAPGFCICRKCGGRVLTEEPNRPPEGTNRKGTTAQFLEVA